jgi:predicted nucleotidyltransferase
MFEKTNLTPLSIDLLKFLSRNPNKEFYITQLAKFTNSSMGGSYAALKNLYKMNLINRRRSGRNLYYMINDKNPALKYIKIFFNLSELNPLIKRISAKSRKVVLFGSCSTGEDTMESDIDLFIVAENTKAIKDIIKTRYVNQRELKPIITTPHGLIEMKNRDRAFYDEVVKGIVLWRSGNE